MSNDVERLTHGLTRPETAAAAAAALAGDCRPAAVEGLVELLAGEHSSRAGAAAVAALEACGGALALDGLTAALEGPHAPVRLAAVLTLHRRGAGCQPAEQERQVGNLPHGTAATFVRLLRRDDSWTVRRGALRALADGPDAMRWHVLDAATDPHWRVRHALIQVLLAWGRTDVQRQDIDGRLGALGESPRVRGLRAYLRYRWSGRVPAPAEVPEAEDPSRACPFWDWDEAVLARNLERLGAAGRRAALDVMPSLVGHPAERVSALAVEVLRRDGEARHLAEALDWLDDPRSGAGAAVQKLLGYLDQDRIEEAARLILHRPATAAARAWAVDQAGPVFPPEEEAAVLLELLAHPAGQPAAVRAALARLAARWRQPLAEGCLAALLDDSSPEVRLEVLRGAGPGRLARWLRDPSPAVRAEAVRGALAGGVGPQELEAFAADPCPEVRVAVAEYLTGRHGPEAEALRARLRADHHPHVRAAALTPAEAGELRKDLSRDTSWHVRFRAARLARVPLWELAPEVPWRPAPVRPAESGWLALDRPAPPHARPLGPGGPPVAPLGVSGHYGLPVEGFARAAEAGVNLFFWEPSYQTLSDFLTRLGGGTRNDLHLIAGTFEADGVRLRRDAERALRVTRVERLALFLLFWVRSWARVTDDVRDALERLKAEGKVAAFGLSTHSRPLAVEALEAGWGPVMVRHSAAHRGAEERIFPRAAELGVGLLTFNNTCYGRLLQARGDTPPPRPADCYRYSLAQAGVTACLSAPATLEQLDENLQALRDPQLPEDRRRLLLAQGERVYEEDTTFRKLVRAL
jgi:hypothetical protein